MTQLPLATSADAARLVRLLKEWVDGDVPAAKRGFAERLGQLFDLPDSIRVSSAHARVSEAGFTSNGLSMDEVRDEFFRGRTALIRSTLRTFSQTSGHTRIRFPQENAAAPAGEAPDAEPYIAFYTTLQRDIDFRARTLQAAVRESVAGISPSLAQLCALDNALTAPLAANHRRLFSAIPGLLRKRFEFLLAEYRQRV